MDNLPFIPPFATLSELKKNTKEYGYKGYSRMKEGDGLIELLSGPPPVKLRELKLMAKQRGLRYSRMKKAQLERLLTSPTLPFRHMTGKRLRALARERGLNSSRNRAALIRRLTGNRLDALISSGQLQTMHFYTVEIEITLQKTGERKRKNITEERKWFEAKSDRIKLVRTEAEEFKKMKNPTDTTNEIAQSLFEKLDMLDWIENRESLAPLVRVVSITLDDDTVNFDHGNVEATDGTAP